MATADTRVTTGKARLSFVHLDKPHKVNTSDPGDGKYSVVVLIPKSDKETIKRLQAAVKAAFEEGIAKKWNGRKPSDWRKPLKDGDDSDRPEYEGHVYFTASSRTPVGVFDRRNNPLSGDDPEVYSGQYAQAAVGAFAYAASGNRGVSFGLNMVRILGNGAPFDGSSRNPDDVFGAPLDVDDLDSDDPDDGFDDDLGL